MPTPFKWKLLGQVVLLSAAVGALIWIGWQTLPVLELRSSISSPNGRYSVVSYYATDNLGAIGNCVMRVGVNDSTRGNQLPAQVDICSFPCHVDPQIKFIDSDRVRIIGTGSWDRVLRCKLPGGDVLTCEYADQ
jgi:hypothetical protein